MKIMIVVGARPNFMKAAPLIRAIQNGNGSTPGLRFEGSNEEVRAVLVHTGQHYDEAMSGSFFTDLGLPKPDIYLGVGSGSHAVQTGEIMRMFEQVILSEQPEALVVVGDVNSTIACALVASKISYEDGGRPVIAHVEAGLRSLDRAMPEEINRIVTDHLSDMLFVTEESGTRNLIAEGVAEDRIHFVGNTMIDSLLASQEKADRSEILKTLGLAATSPNGTAAKAAKKYALLTLHRPSNVDNRAIFSHILDGIDELAAAYPIFFAAHPRTRKRIAEFGLESHFNFDGGAHSKGIRLLEPLGYLDFMCLMKHAAVVVTDSGGIQEETTCLGVPCVTVRENTERPVTVTCGTNVIAGTDSKKVREAIRLQLVREKSGKAPEKWDGRAAERIVGAIVAELTKRQLETAAK